MLTGFVTGASLIIAIGAQNAFVLTQGIRGQYVGLVSLTCAIIDIILICAGIAGMGQLINSSPVLLLVATFGGAMFLTVYGALSAKSAVTRRSLDRSSSSINSWTKAFVVTLSLSLLNPHVYLDTVILLGSIGSQFGEALKWWYALGACLASIVWFLTLGYGAGRLSGWFAKPRAWQILDSIIALVMWTIAAALWYRGVERIFSL